MRFYGFPVAYQHEAAECGDDFDFGNLGNFGNLMASPDSEVPYGTLDLMVLKTLAGMGPLHGYGIARRIEQAAAGALALNQGTIYPALLRLEQKGWIKSDWGTSDNNRRARFYAITAAGRRQLTKEAKLWERTVSMVNRLLEDRS